MLLAALREQVVEVGLQALERGVVHGASGNMSVRDPGTDLIAIWPSGMPYPTVTPAAVVVIDLDGTVVDSRRKPSSETPLHHGPPRAPARSCHRPHRFPLFDRCRLHSLLTPPS